jgi:F1F0 ATPase subunit 2
MNNPAGLIFAIAGGGVLGIIFFGGLWWTVSRGLTSSSPALWFFGSLMVRMGLTVIGFILITGGQWQRGLACLLGFFAARIAVTSLTRETKHAP